MNLPPYLSRTPPPLNNNEEEENEDEDFGTFVSSSDLGEEVYEVFDKACTIKGEDNVSEDSGFCMNSFGQTQSPCDISPLSSSYPNKGNEGVNDDTPESTVIDCPLSETNSIADNKNVSNPGPVLIDQCPERQDRLTLENDIDETVLGKRSENDDILFSTNGVQGENNVEHSITIPGDLNVRPQSQNCDAFEQSCEEEEEEEPDSNQSKCKSKSNSSLQNDPDLPVSISDIPDINFSNKSHLGEFEIVEFNGDLPHDAKNNEISFQIDAIAGEIKDGVNDPINDRGPDDDFSDFAEFQSSSSIIEQTAEESIPNFESRFPDQSSIEENINIDICELQSAVQTNVIWNYLQCFEETSACKYQWSTSCTNMKFLKALQIDSRNIFHGPWSKINKIYWSDVPPPCDSSFSSKFSDSRVLNLKVQPESSVPDAHFDWVGSGLVNPLQPTSTKHHTPELLTNNSSGGIQSKKNDLLATLPTLKFVKAHYIVFKRN